MYRLTLSSSPHENEGWGRSVEIVSTRRSQLDDIALKEAIALLDRQPRCTITFGTDFSAITIYNYGKYGPVPGGSAATNSTALSNMLAAMNAANPVGGLAWIEQFNFPINPGSGSGYAVADQSIIQGLGGGGKTTGGGASSTYHFSVSGDGTFFYCSGPHTSGGQYFNNLAIAFVSAALTSTTAIYAGTWNCRAIKCTFTDCPLAFNAQGLSAGMEQCTIEYTTGPNGASAVILSAPQTYVIGPGEFFQTSINSGGPTGCTCIDVRNVEHMVVNNLHISDWTFAINYGIGNNSSTVAGNVSFVEAQSYQTCVNMQCANNKANIFAQKYTSCTFELSTNASNPNPTISSLFIIDPNGGANSNIEDIELTNCSIFQSNLHGIEIRGGQKIRVTGGQYSGNGPSGGAGIAITGACGDVSIIGANLGAKYFNATIPQNQQYALLISASPNGTVIVDSCQMGGYSASPVSVTGTPSELLITNCPGYNDQNTVVASSGFTSNQHAAALGYFGPSVITWSNSASITVTLNGTSFTSTFGSIYLQPYDVIKFSAAPSHITWIGK